MRHLGDFSADATVRTLFTTNDSSGGAVAPSTAFEAADVKVYKNSSATQRTSEAGYTMTSPFDSITGLHLIEIDTSENTDAGFYAAGNDYTIILDPSDETVDSQTVVAVLGSFSIENRSVISRISSTLFAGITSLAEWLGLMAGKQTADATALAEIKATGAGSGAYSEADDSLEAIRDRGDAAWISATGTGTATIEKQDQIINTLAATTVSVTSPVVDDTTIEVVTGDDYHVDDSRALTFSKVISTEDITGATVSFRVTDLGGTNKIDASGTVVTATGTQVVRVDLTAAEVATLTAAGEAYTFHLKILHDTRTITVAQGKVTALPTLF